MAAAGTSHQTEQRPPALSTAPCRSTPSVPRRYRRKTQRPRTRCGSTRPIALRHRTRPLTRPGPTDRCSFRPVRSMTARLFAAAAKTAAEPAPVVISAQVFGLRQRRRQTYSVFVFRASPRRPFYRGCSPAWHATRPSCVSASHRFRTSSVLCRRYAEHCVTPACRGGAGTPTRQNGPPKQSRNKRVRRPGWDCAEERVARVRADSSAPAAHQCTPLVFARDGSAPDRWTSRTAARDRIRAAPRARVASSFSRRMQPSKRWPTPTEHASSRTLARPPRAYFPAARCVSMPRASRYEVLVRWYLRGGRSARLRWENERPTAERLGSTEAEAPC